MRGNIDNSIGEALSPHKGEDLTTQQIADLVPHLTLKQVQSAMARMSSRGNKWGIARVRHGVYRMPLRRPSVVAAFSEEPRKRTVQAVSSKRIWEFARQLKSGAVLLEDSNGELWRAVKIDD